MLLDDLHKLIEMLQARIAEHGAALRAKEARTRSSLIDPLLRGLNWDTADPTQVVVEFPTEDGSVDYALLDQNGKPQILVEAKKLGTALDNRVRKQVAFYCLDEGVSFAVITDGQHWKIYDVSKGEKMRDSLVTEFDLTDEPATTCLKALALWRHGVEASSVAPIEEPIVTKTGGDPSPPPPLPPLPPGWQPLDEFKPANNASLAALRLPDGSEVALKAWADLCRELVRWMKSQGHLTKEMLPFQLGKAKPLVDLKPDGLASGRPVDGWFVGTGFNKGQHVRNAQGLVARVTPSLKSYAVRLK